MENHKYELDNEYNPFALLERIVRVEEALKHQSDLMKQGFTEIDKRFTVMLWIIAGGFGGTWTILGIMLSKLF